jgi:hypothetical protein
MASSIHHWTRTCALAVLVLLLIVQRAQAQNRGIYPLGMSATSSGLMPSSGTTYAMQLLYYSRGEAITSDGHALPVTGNHAVLLNTNTLTWVSEKFCDRFRYSASVSVPIASNSLTSDLQGNMTGGTGLGDLAFTPVIVAWAADRFAWRVIYGFLAPTGHFAAGATDNVGAGYWTHTFSSGQTAYLLKSKRLALSAFEFYEIHTTQEGTGVHPGQTLSIDYSLMGCPLYTDTAQLQVGWAGYEQRQTTATTTPAEPRTSPDRYAINAVGFAVSGIFPKRGVSVSARFFREFSNRSTFQGSSVQLATSITF